MSETKEYRRCRYCGAYLDPGDSFCQQCGRSAEQSYERSPAPSAQHEEEQGRRYRPPENRYRQERLEGSWSEDWGRPENESQVTGLQYVLIALIVVLLAALAAMGGFWFFARSSDRSGRQAAVQRETERVTEQTVTEGNAVTILDPQTEAPAPGTEAPQTETMAPETVAPQTETAAPQSVTPQSETAALQTETTASETAAPQTETNAPETAAPQSDTQGQAGAESQTAASWSQPESSSRLLTDSDLEGLTYDGMQMAINEIYARHGRIFQTPEIRSYFESQPWYEGTVDAAHFDESVFSAVESQNIAFLLERMGDG